MIKSNKVRQKVFLPIGLVYLIYHAKFAFDVFQGGGSGLGLTQNSWFNSCHGLFSLLTPIINANTLSFKHLMNILPAFNLKIEFYMP